MRRRTLESVLLHTQHRGRGRRGRKGGRAGLLLRPTAQPLYKPKMNSLRLCMPNSSYAVRFIRLSVAARTFYAKQFIICTTLRTGPFASIPTLRQAKCLPQKLLLVLLQVLRSCLLYTSDAADE